MDFSQFFFYSEYGPGFLAVVIFGSYPHPRPVNKLDRYNGTLRKSKERQLLTGEGGRGGGGAISYDGEKVWSFIIHEILSTPGL
jgi:hypothetical protein